MRTDLKCDDGIEMGSESGCAQHVSQHEAAVDGDDADEVVERVGEFVSVSTLVFEEAPDSARRGMSIGSVREGPSKGAGGKTEVVEICTLDDMLSCRRAKMQEQGRAVELGMRAGS